MLFRKFQLSMFYPSLSLLLILLCTVWLVGCPPSDGGDEGEGESTEGESTEGESTEGEATEGESTEGEDVASAHEDPGDVTGETKTVMLPGDVPLELVWVAPQTFTMGRNMDEMESSNYEDPIHDVTFSIGYWIGKYEITKGQWEAVMGAGPWVGEWGVPETPDPNEPATYMNWHEAVAFCEALSEHTENTFRLPREAEWEAACRAGTRTRFYWGDDLESADIADYAWYQDSPHVEGVDRSHVVGQLLPNDWGLYDMSGNVWEWCQDWYGEYSESGATETDPTGPEQRWQRVTRGGDFASDAGDVRSAGTRVGGHPDNGDEQQGLRVVW
jgi:formylglycine-generating enzyme required for sulfatase activity